MSEFEAVTELGGDEVSAEQVGRVCTRYGWALDFCRAKDVLEVACGTGPGLGLLQKHARSLLAGDISDSILDRARSHYGNRINLRKMDAMALPVADQSLDVIIVFEALYYVPDALKFIAECRRTLRPGGCVLVSNANKNLYDFNPSPHSFVYHGVVELRQVFAAHGFESEFWGDIPTTSVSWRQRILRPIKKIVVGLGLMPNSMAGKRLLKRLVFGQMERFPAEISDDMIPPLTRLTPLDPEKPDRTHKVILCAASLPKQSS